MIKTLKQLEAGMYADAQESNPGSKYVSVSNYLGELSAKGDIEEGLIVDPATLPLNSQGRRPSYVEQALAHSGIVLGGLNASSMGAFFGSDSQSVSGARTLWPALAQETFERALMGQHGVGLTRNTGESGGVVHEVVRRDGLVSQLTPETNPLLLQASDLVRTTTGIDGSSYRAAQIKDPEGSLKPSRVAERTEIPVYEIKLGEVTIKVYKYGSRINASYESIRNMRVNQVLALIEALGRAEREMQTDMAIEVLINGDGNGNAVIAQNIGASYSIKSFNEWILKLVSTNAANINLVFGSFDEVVELLALSYNSTGQGNALQEQMLAGMVTGAIRTPLGQTLKVAPASAITTGQDALYGVDTSMGVERVVENDSYVEESQRFITNQTTDTVTTVNMGFAKTFQKAAYKGNKAA